MVQDLAVQSGRLCMCHGPDNAERESSLISSELQETQFADTVLAC